MNTFSEQTRKNIAACMLAPLSVFPALFMLYLAEFVLSNITQETMASSGLLEVAVLVSFIGWFVALVLTLAYGLPIALFLQKIDQFKVQTLVPLSLVPISLAYAFSDFDYGGLAIFGYCSITVAITYFYLFNRRGEQKAS